MTSRRVAEAVLRSNWSKGMTEDQKQLYLNIMREARRRGLPFAIGGGFASNAYTFASRNTKDLDVFVLPRDRERFIELLNDAGLRDYHEQLPYDRSWIYRGYQDDLIVDVIWQMANHRARVDEIWLERGPHIDLEGQRFRVIPPEETLWTKLYVLQRERCDWPDALNLLSTVGPELDWRRLIERVGDDAALLGAVLSVFAWICPQRARELPAWLWDTLPAHRPEHQDPRAHLLDSRPWLVNPC